MERREERLRQLHPSKPTTPTGTASEATKEEIMAKRFLERGSHQLRDVKKKDEP